MNNQWKDPIIIVKVCGVAMIACPLMLLMIGNYGGALLGAISIYDRYGDQGWAMSGKK